MRRVERLRSVGEVLAQDLTEVVAGQVKRVALSRGHRIAPEDLELMARLGKEHVYVEDDGPATGLPENEAARLLATAAAGSGVQVVRVQEGKADLVASRAGWLRVDRERVDRFNRSLQGTAALITLPDRRRVAAGDRLAVARIYPLSVSEAVAERLGQVGVAVRVRPIATVRAAAVITGEEVKSGRVADAFAPLLRDKLHALGSALVAAEVVGDDPDAIAAALLRAAEVADLVFVTGGLAVDPDDVTGEAVRRSGAEVAFQGVPLLPGTLLLGATLNGKPLLGVPAGTLYDRYGSLDVLLPWVLAEGMPSAAEVASLGVGGLMGGGHVHTPGADRR